MKALIINCFETYGRRASMVERYFNNKNYSTEIVTSDFEHFSKSKVSNIRNNHKLIKTLTYKKNISVRRIISHVLFSYRAYKYVRKCQADLLYVFLPPNVMAYLFTKLKKKTRNIILIYDIIDLWPETFPSKNRKYNCVFNFWRKIRNTNLKNADKIITECNLFKDVLVSQNGLNPNKIHTLFMANSDIDDNSIVASNLSEIKLCYLGSINNVIDLEKVILVIESIKVFKRVSLHIIGDGESRTKLLRMLEEKHIDYIYYGKIYNVEEKRKIMSYCHFGLNIMKSTVCVGLTMKSIDYLRYGLPLINNIKFDTKRFVQSKKIGFNLSNNNVYKQICELTNDDYRKMRAQVFKVYSSKFSETAFTTELNQILDDK